MTRPDTATKLATDVSTMFDEVSPRYDLINDVLTVGNDRLWRIATTKAIGPRKGMRVLDLAAGTGTSSAAIAKHGAHVVAADFSEGMLAEGRKRHAGNDLIDFVFADATALPFDDDSFDAATISYGLRNVSDPRKALREMHRVVKPGGRIVIAEFSTPPSAAVRVPYGLYGRHVLPRVAGLINREAAEAYRYLNESIEEWPTQERLAGWLREAGFERVAYRNLTLGIVALHRGFVPRRKVVAEDQASPAAKPKSAAKPAAAPETQSKPKASPAKKTSAATTKSAAAKAKPAAAESKPAAAKTSAASAKAANASAVKPADSKASPAKGAAPKQPAKPASRAGAKPAAKQPSKTATKSSAASAPKKPTPTKKAEPQ